MVNKVEQAIAVLCVLSIIIPQFSTQDINYQPCLSLNWVACGASVGTALYKKYYGTWQDSQDVNAFGTVCKTQFRGSFYRWKWVWGGNFWCPSISDSVRGTSEHYKSREGAIEHALQNYVQVAGAAGLLTQQQIEQYNQGK